ncbi:hypothetical protein RhiLY_12191 [Ceratobasidium sp. AG-Ba]|nr:hypothetical protein RhiLY_12191 [Ceratobasidium sp. AG-Ba]
MTPYYNATHTRQTKDALIWNRTQRRSTDPGGLGGSAAAGLAVSSTIGGSEEPTGTGPNGRFRVQSRAAFLTWSKLTEEPTSGLVARYEAFCRNRPNHWATLAVVERHDPEEPNFDPDRPLHVHALTISQERKGGWNTQNARFWDFEGNHPNILQKGLQDVGENGEEVEELMAGELTLEALEGILTEGRRGKRSREQADLEDGEEIVGSPTREEFYQAYKRLRPLDMTKSWNSIRAYAEFAYKTDAGLLPAIPVNLEAPEYRDHIDQANRWFDQEVQPKGPGMRHRILVIEGETGTGKTAYARSKGLHSRMCNVWNVANLSEDADVWILDNMESTNGKYSLKALSQYKADFTGRYQRVKTMKWVFFSRSDFSVSEEARCWVALDQLYREECPITPPPVLPRSPSPDPFQALLDDPVEVEVPWSVPRPQFVRPPVFAVPKGKKPYDRPVSRKRKRW